MPPAGTSFVEYVEVRSFADWERSKTICLQFDVLYMDIPSSKLPFPNMTLQAKTRNEVAAEYGISTKTLKRWLAKHNITITERDRIPPKELANIYLAFGNPKVSNDD